MDGFDYFIVLFVIIGVLVFVERGIVKDSIAHRWPRISGSKWRFIVYVIMLLLYIVPNFRIMFTRDVRPSPVDASLIEHLPQELINQERITNVIDSLRDHDNILRFEIDILPRQRDLALAYRFTYRHEYRNVSVHVEFFRDEQRLIERLPRWSDRFARRGSLVLDNENNTQVFLYASYMQRSYIFLPIPNRAIQTELRLGNVRIFLNEQRDWRELYPNASSDFIRMLYDLLVADA